MNNFFEILCVVKTFKSIICIIDEQIIKHKMGFSRKKSGKRNHFFFFQAHVKLLRSALEKEKEVKENLTVELNQELSRKQEAIDNLERHISYNGSKNAAEELQSEHLNVSVWNAFLRMFFQ